MSDSLLEILPQLLRYIPSLLVGVVIIRAIYKNILKPSYYWFLERRLSGRIKDEFQKSTSMDEKFLKQELLEKDIIPALYIERLELINIRSFSHLKIDFSGDDGPFKRIIVLGDNALGKSTLLKSLALLLCNESEAISLIASMNGEIIKKGKLKAIIRGKVVNSLTGESYDVEKEITKSPSNEEIVRHSAPSNYPTKSIFLWGCHKHHFQK